jgi:thiamine pyrophosphokinase
VRLALVLAGGRLVPTARVLEAAGAAEFMVAADGGAVHALALGRRPDLWVGDFDSSPPALEGALKGVPREAHPRDKARVDAELALEAARARGAEAALVLGALGGRFDHALALLLVAARLTAEGSRWPSTPATRPPTSSCPAGRSPSASSPARPSRCSPSAWPPQGLTVAGARWPLRSVELPSGMGWGVSNEALGPVELSLAGGLAAVVVQYQAA